MLLKLLFPSRCVICKNIVPDAREETICRECQKSLPFLMGNDRKSNGEFFDECVSACRYEGALRKSILRYKFGAKKQYVGVYAELLAKIIKEEYSGEYDLISWVPVSRKRKLRRGYDQAFLLADAAAKRLETKCVRVLAKVKHNKPQSGIHDDSQRRANVLGAYKTFGEVAGKRILLVDDIVTSGATLGEASRTLLMAGADSVLCATLAKAKHRKKTNSV